MCKLEFDEQASVWTNRMVTARKQHVCSCCGGLIPAGATYRRHFSVFDGDLTCEKACGSCVKMIDGFLEVHGAAGTPGSMRPLLDECIEAETYDGHTRMAARWKAEVRKMDARRATRLRKAGEDAGGGG